MERGEGVKKGQWGTELKAFLRSRSTEVLGIGIIVDDFQSEGRAPVEREELKMMERGAEIERAVE